MSKPLPVVLTIAGSDSSCGAGAQADLKTISSLGCHGLTAITCIVAETPGNVRSIQAVRSEIVRDQLEVLLAAYPVAAIKTGMLFSAPIIRVVAEAAARAVAATAAAREAGTAAAMDSASSAAEQVGR